MVDRMYTDGDARQVEHDMYDFVSNFQSFSDRYNYEDWKSYLKDFFYYIPLASKKKCFYIRQKLVGEASLWLEGHSNFYLFWCYFKAFHTWYASYLLSLLDYFLKYYMSPSFEPNIEQECML